MRKTPFFVLVGIGAFLYGGFVGFGQPGWFMPEARVLNEALADEFEESLNEPVNVTEVDFDSCAVEGQWGECYPEYSYWYKTENGNELKETTRLDEETIDQRFSRIKRLRVLSKKDEFVVGWRYQAGEGKATDPLYDARSDRFDTYDEHEVYEEAQRLLNLVLSEVSESESAEG